MPESELLTKILSDFTAVENANYSDSEKELLAKFCSFSAQWLFEHGCLGLGHAAEGLKLRFSDGSEFVLFSVPTKTQPPARDVSISGNNTKLAVNAAPIANTSFQITGR